jgi:hypothetical protein
VRDDDESEHGQEFIDSSAAEFQAGAVAATLAAQNRAIVACGFAGNAAPRRRADTLPSSPASGLDCITLTA